jgi:hypothetical protein
VHGEFVTYWRKGRIQREINARISQCWILQCEDSLAGYITVDAMYDADLTPHYDASGFYEKFGFKFVNSEEALPPSTPYRTMYLDLKPLIDLLDNSD